MYPQPRYLELQQQLFPPVTLHKELLFDSPSHPFRLQSSERLAYHSLQRAIDLTPALLRALKQFYKQETEVEVWICDPLLEDYRLLAFYPFQGAVTLGEQFLQLDVLLLRFKEGAGERGRRRRTIRQVLEVGEQWRKLCLASGWKVSLQEGAEAMGISKRSLFFYLQQIKLGEKLGFKFEERLEGRMSELVLFVSERSQGRKKELQLLGKLKSYCK